MRHPTPDNLVCFNRHMRRDHAQRPGKLAELMANKKSRDVYSAETIKLALYVGLNWKDTDLLDLAIPDKAVGHWLLVAFPTWPSKARPYSYSEKG